MRQKHRFHGLKKIKVRQTWNKYNLYNLSRLRPQTFTQPTFFQQKWSAKSMTRSYHGEYIREKQWQKMFRPFTPAVVPLNPTQLAEFDGSEQAEGRGSGKDVDPRDRQYQQQRIPYMGMVYGPMERRLDQAIFRALFASSARQARQFVVHGGVKVNGKRMIYPGYLLNPGDMFQVDPDRVMFATGEQKDQVKKRIRRTLKSEKQRQAERVQAIARRREASLKETEEAEQPQEPVEEQLKETTNQPEGEAEGEAEEAAKAAEKAKRKEILKKRKEAQDHIKFIIKVGKDKLSAKKKQELRAMIAEIASTPVDKTNLEPIMSRLQPAPKPEKQSQFQDRTQDHRTQSPNTQFSRRDGDNYKTVQERDAIARVVANLEELSDNPVDLSKPYATPWKPRPWMAPFVFIPRYLEVNQRICAAVYLRNPVARPGLAEVPSPFPVETSQLAFNWYLRRR